MNDNFYLKDGKQYDRVTNILKTIHDPDLENLRRVKGFRNVDEIFRVASERGKSFHAAMKLIADKKYKGMIRDAYEAGEMYQTIEAGETWIARKDFKIVFTEKTFYDDKNLYAGTPDLLTMDENGVYTIWDYKTGAKILPTYSLQLAAYTAMVEKEMNIKIKNRVIIHARDGKIKEYKIKSSKELDKNMFFYVLYLHRNIFK